MLETDLWEDLPEKKHPFLLDIAQIWGGPPAQIDFDVFFKVKTLPKLRAKGVGVNWAMPKRKGVFSGRSSLIRNLYLSKSFSARVRLVVIV